jgi:hypothetical protein
MQAEVAAALTSRVAALTSRAEAYRAAVLASPVEVLAVADTVVDTVAAASDLELRPA